MKLLQLDIQGTPNIGLYGFATNYFCLLGTLFPQDVVEQIEKTLKVPCYTIHAAASSLIGALVTGNSSCLLLPSIIEDDELAAINKIVAAACKKHSISMKTFVVPSKLTALGNNILCNDSGCLVNPGYSADVKKLIRQSLNVPLHPGMLSDAEVVGSCAVHTTSGGVVHMHATPEQKEEVESLLQIPFVHGTANFGSPYLRSAVLCNDYGLVVGSTSTGIEIENIYEGLGFLGQK